MCAVVALRQVQRQVEREKEQIKEGERERTEHTLKQITHLQKQLKNKDKDCNLLLVSHTHIHSHTPLFSLRGNQWQSWLTWCSTQVFIIKLKALKLFSKYFQLISEKKLLREKKSYE